MSNTGAAVCALSLILCTACQTAKPIARPPTTSIAFDKTAVKLGEEIRIIPTRPLNNWTGEATVNTFRARLPIDSKNNVVHVTRDNGFTTLSPSEICVALKDAHGKDIPVANECVHVTVSAAAFQLQPESDTVNAAGGTGRVAVQGDSSQWEIGGAPDWIKLTRDQRVGFDPEVVYTVAKNDSFKARTASIAIGDARFDITQSGSPYVGLPYAADFSKVPIPVWQLPSGDLQAGTSHDQPPQWVLDDQPGQNATVQVSTEGPSNSAALVVDRPVPANEAWKTLIWLPGLLTKPGSRYKVSVWLKAANPAPVGLEFGQRTDPHDSCGLFKPLDVPSEWRHFTVDFKAAAARCGADNNRLTIHAGRIFGKLWISGLTVSAE